MKKLITFILMILMIDNPAYSITLTEAVKQSWSMYEQIKAQSNLVDLSKKDIWRRFIPNEPQFQFNDLDTNNEQTFGLGIAIGFPGKNIALSKLDRARLEAQRNELMAKKYDLAKLTVQSYVDCAISVGLVSQQKVNVQDLEGLLRSVKSRYESGVVTQSEVISAELQLRQQKFDLTTAEDKIAVNCQKINQLLNQSDEDHYTLPDDLDPNLIDEFGNYTADQQRARGTLAVSEANYKTALWSQAPDFNVSGSANHWLYIPFSQTGKAWTANVGVGVTLPFLFPIQERLDARKAKDQAIIDKSNAEIQLINSHADRHDGEREYHRSSDRLHQLRVKDLPLAEALLESTLSSYRSGRVGFAEVVIARKILADLRIQEIQLKGSVINAHFRCLNDCKMERKDPTEMKP